MASSCTQCRVVEAEFQRAVRAFGYVSLMFPLLVYVGWSVGHR